MPAKDPLLITSVEQAQRLLRQRRPFRIYQGDLSDPAQIVDKSVEGNIFRTFGGLDEKPSVAYRDWAKRIYLRLQAALESVKKQQQYDDLIQDYARQLAAHWKKVHGSKLPDGPATKMINLLVKTMFLNGQLDLPRLPTWYNVPFDSFTLIPLIEIIDELLPQHLFAIPMNQQMTMNYIIHEAQYHDLQRAIRTLCTGTDRTPLDYELWAWDSRH
jgi:hypothetical protein